MPLVSISVPLEPSCWLQFRICLSARCCVVQVTPSAEASTGILSRGNETLAAVFKDRLYFFSSEERLQKFMKTPWK